MAAAKRLARLLRQYESCRITKAELRHHLEKRVIGHVTGIVGPFVLRYQNGKLIISDRPLLFRKSMSPAWLAERNRFSARVKFAKFLNADKCIKSAWQNAETEGYNSWTKLLKHNNIRGTAPTTKNIITPGKYHFAVGKICSLGKDFSINRTENYSFNENYNLSVIIVPFDPVEKISESFEIFSVKGSSLSKEQMALCSRYKKYIMYTAVIKNDGSEWSNTVAIEGSFAEDKKCDAEKVLDWLFYLERELRPGVLVRKSEVKTTKNRQKLRCVQ